MIKLGLSLDSFASGFSARTFMAPAACLIALCGALALSLGEGKTLIAESGSPADDLDSDGLSAQQEYLLGTDDFTSDSDFDGFSDLEELARGSNPRVKSSIPNLNALGTKAFGASAQGIFTFQVVVFVKNSDISDLTLEVGLVNKSGDALVFGPDALKSATFFSKQATNPADLIVVMTAPIDEAFISKVGQVNLFTRIQDMGPQARTASATTLTVVEHDDIIFEITTSPNSVMQGDGVIYRPLNGPDDPSPATAVSGQVCWQDVLPVSSNGNLIQFEVQSSSCQDFDSFCDASACNSAFGAGVELVDPGSLLGG